VRGAPLPPLPKHCKSAAWEWSDARGPSQTSDWPSGSGDWPRSSVANGSVWKCLAVSGPEGVKIFCGLHAAVLAVIGRSESGPTGSVCGSVGAPRGGRSANQMSAMVLAHRTTPTLPIYSVLAVAAVVPPSQYTAPRTGNIARSVPRTFTLARHTTAPARNTTGSLDAALVCQRRAGRS
jgi:hypothetical protein